MFSRNRGFTLIELLVVIAIIGILSSVVLASLNTARDKGRDAAIKSDLNNIRAQAELVYDNDGDYALVCSDTNVDRAIIAAGGPATADCADDAAGWGAEAALQSVTGYYCVDYTGNATTVPAATITEGSDFTCD
ncbi:type II secretion system GspH family protein [Candidatus Wolfebacteria bacterium]|nr:type II secretion system GspH family protein [Candidatus Wolfebacteria bacterium]